MTNSPTLNQHSTHDNNYPIASRIPMCERVIQQPQQSTLDSCSHDASQHRHAACNRHKDVSPPQWYRDRTHHSKLKSSFFTSTG